MEMMGRMFAATQDSVVTKGDAERLVLAEMDPSIKPRHPLDSCATCREAGEAERELADFKRARSGRTILVVSDEDRVRHSGVRALVELAARRTGAEVVFVRPSQDVRLETALPGVVIHDSVPMPKSTSREEARHKRQRERREAKDVDRMARSVRPPSPSDWTAEDRWNLLRIGPEVKP